MFSIVIPLFNESENIEKLIFEIEVSLKKIRDYEIILVDDGSTDKTSEIIKKNNFDRVKLFNNLKNKGQSFSIVKGIKNSINDIIVTLDGDGQNDPKDIPKLLDIYLNNQDIKLVGGIRENRKDNYSKIVASKIANYIRSKILKDRCKDTGCSLKVFEKKIFLSFPYFDGIHRFLPALFNGYGYKTKFVSVKHRKREFGISKYGNLRRLYSGIGDIVKVKNIIKERKS